MSTVRVFVNGKGVEVPAGISALDAVAAIDRAEAEGVHAGRLLITDSRGIAIPSHETVFGGAIYRTIRAKPRLEE